MFDFKLISQSKNKIQVNHEQNDKLATEHYNKALKSIELFNLKKPYNKNYLKDAFDNLTISLKHKRNNGDAYLWMSYICFIYDDRKNATKYLKVAQEFPNTSINLEQLKKLILTR